MNDFNPQVNINLPQKSVEAAKIDAETRSKRRQALFGPVAEEIGLFAQDQVRYWRAARWLTLEDKYEKKRQKRLNSRSSPLGFLHPRMTLELLEHGTKTDDERLQDMWASLAVDSLGHNDENLVYLNILKEMSSVEAAIFEFSALQSCGTYISEEGIIESRCHTFDHHVFNQQMGYDLNKSEFWIYCSRLQKLGLTGHKTINLFGQCSALSTTGLFLYKKLQVEAHDMSMEDFYNPDPER